MSKTLKIALASMFAFAFVLTANASAPATNFAGNMMMGSTGQGVKELQMFLNACPDTALAVNAGTAGSVGYETMTFGPATKAAVMKYQAKVGVITTGNFYPLTRAQASAVGNVCGGVVGGTFAPAGCTAASGFSPVTGGACYAVGNNPPVVGLTGEGTVKDFAVSTADQSDFSEGQSKVELVAFDVELDNDGSLKMDRFDLYMGQDNGVTASNDPWDYFEKAYLMVDGTTVASMNVDSESDWSEYDTGTLATTSQEYRLRFTGLNAILASDEVSKVTVAFDIASNLDSGDEDAVWQFGTTADSFRFVDGTGFVFTDGEDLADSFGADTQDEADFDLTDASTNPDASVIEIGQTDDTNGVTLYKFDIEENNDVDANVEEMTMTFTTTVQADEAEVIKKAYLYDGATLLGSETVATGGAVTFDNLDLDLNGNDTKTLTVKVDLDDVTAGVTEATTIKVGTVDLSKFTDANGNDENDIAVTATGDSNTFELRSQGIQVAFVSSSTEKTFTADAATEDDQGTYKITFDVTAFGADMYIDNSSEVAGGDAAGQGVEFAVTSTAGTPVLGSDLLESNTADAQDTANVFQVEKNQTRRFTLTVIYAADTTPTDGSHSVAISSINWGTATDDTNANYYTFDLGDYKTGALFLNGIA